jgi:hypothetical protein
MATYQVQAPDGKTITLEGPDGASQSDIIAQAQRLYQPQDPSFLQETGRNLASIADLAIEGVGGALGVPAYAAGYLGNEGAKAINSIAGMFGAEQLPLPTSSERAQSWRNAVTQPFQGLVGGATGVANTPEYKEMPVRTMLEDLGQWTGENIVQPVAGAMEVPESDVQQLVDTALLVGGPKIARGAADVTAKTARGAADIVKQVPEGIAAGLTAAEPKFSYKPTPEVLNAAKSATNTGSVGDIVLALNNQTIPHRGKLTASTAENIVRGYRDSASSYGGIQGLADLAGLIGLQLPVGSMVKGAQRGSQALSPLRYDATMSEILGKPIITNRTGSKALYGMPRPVSAADWDFLTGKTAQMPTKEAVAPAMTQQSGQQSTANPKPVPETSADIVTKVAYAKFREELSKRFGIPEDMPDVKAIDALKNKGVKNVPKTMKQMFDEIRSRVEDSMK